MAIDASTLIGILAKDRLFPDARWAQEVPRRSGPMHRTKLSDDAVVLVITPVTGGMVIDVLSRFISMN
jgi:molybdopterin converting factor small subunit